MFKKLLKTMACLVGVSLMAENAFMGDWCGTLKNNDGGENKVFAQVIDLGGGEYRAVFTESLYQAPVPKTLMTLTGKLNGETVTFNDGIAKITDGAFTGKAPLGEFALKPYCWQSPTLGEQPPKGATVLIGPGLRLSRWRVYDNTLGCIDFRKLWGGNDDCVAYMRCVIVSNKAQRAYLRSGSDDGLMFFQNGRLIYSYNQPRMRLLGMDYVPFMLEQGRNEILLKITQGGGGWNVQAAIEGEDGKALKDVVYENAKTLPTEKGIILSWDVAGPYRMDGKGGIELGTEAFAPEKGEPVAWRHIELPATVPERWKVLDNGVVELIPGNGGISSVGEYGSCRMHVEFKNSLMASQRGQLRCNSGVYIHGRYEFQILDSYGLIARDNDCGGLYQQGTPLVNMCLPPEQWQTFDIDFTAAKFDASGVKTDNARVTVRLNGVVIHDNLEIKHPTPGGYGDVDKSTGWLYLQDHGNVVQFRNIWYVEK